jgi:predicted nuclease of predicted toxin-antitoxin system
MIKFLADENIPFPVVEFLRERGFDVQEATEGGIHGVSDDTIMQSARQSGRVLLTFDKHFANILVYPPDSHFGVIRIRIHPPLIDDVIKAFDQLLQKLDTETITGTLIVLEREGFRVRRAH